MSDVTVERNSRVAKPIVRMEGVYKRYLRGGVSVNALDGVDLVVTAGDYLAITGPSGSGKSTLMNMLGCLDVPDEGHVWITGQAISGLGPDELSRLRNRVIGFIFQGFNLLARTSALENVETPLIYANVPRAERRERARRLLERVGLADRMDHEPNQLSGGQQQRVAVARALVNTPALLLADEPTGNLDSATSNDIMDLLGALNRDDGVTIILITHEADIAARARRQLVLRDGKLVT